MHEKTAFEQDWQVAAYVYLNYGVHWLLNFVTRDAAGDAGFDTDLDFSIWM